MTRFKEVASLVAEGIAETLYPTRCAVCDRPGTLLCARCEAALDYIDYWRACPRCGGMWGATQCTECNPIALAPYGLEHVPFDSCRNLVLFDQAAHRIVTAYKDEGEQRLADVIARIMAPAVSPELLSRLDAVTYIPATRAAIRRRDFDHAYLIACALARELSVRRSAGGKAITVLSALRRPHTRDQRKLHKSERRENMRGAFSVDPSAAGQITGRCLLLVDDVMTTGSTLYDATAALRAAGAAEVHCLTFAHA